MNRGWVVFSLRLRRYFQPKAGGLKCSAAALKMWQDPTQRHLAAKFKMSKRACCRT